jgi:hypothetical protein
MIFTKRNAIVGFVALKALRRARRARRRKGHRALRIAGLVTLVAVAVGTLVGGIAVAGRRWRTVRTSPSADGAAQAPERDARASVNGRSRSTEPASAA